MTVTIITVIIAVIKNNQHFKHYGNKRYGKSKFLGVLQFRRVFRALFNIYNAIMRKNYPLKKKMYFQINLMIAIGYSQMVFSIKV